MKPKSANSGRAPKLTGRIATLWIATLSLALLAGGCTQDSKQSSRVDPIGTYTLSSIDGKEVPSLMKHGGYELAVNSGTLTFNPDRTCVCKTIFMASRGETVTREANADYKRHGSTLKVKWHGAGKTKGKIEGDLFTMKNEGMVMVYRLQASNEGHPKFFRR